MEMECCVFSSEDIPRTNVPHSNLLVALVKLIVASIIILFATWIRPKLSKGINLHNDCMSSLAIFNPGIFNRLSRRSVYALSKIGQCNIRE